MAVAPIPDYKESVLELTISLSHARRRSLRRQAQLLGVTEEAVVIRIIEDRLDRLSIETPAKNQMGARQKPIAYSVRRERTVVALLRKHEQAFRALGLVGIPETVVLDPALTDYFARQGGVKGVVASWNRRIAEARREKYAQLIRL